MCDSRGMIASRHYIPLKHLRAVLRLGQLSRYPSSMFRFIVYIDLPLVLILLAAFLANFQSFAHSKNVDTSVDLVAKLPQAKFRIIAFFVTLISLCWLGNIGVWIVLVLIFFVGLIPTMITADQSDGLVLVAAAAFVREWAFGFPTLVLRPKPSLQNEEQGIVGRTGIVTSPLKPSGRVSIDDTQIQAVSDGGDFIETGVQITVTGFRNGTPSVRKIETATTNDG